MTVTCCFMESTSSAVISRVFLSPFADLFHGLLRSLSGLHAFGDVLCAFPDEPTISLVEEALRSASLLTSSATTAKPLPCSPAGPLRWRR